MHLCWSFSCACLANRQCWKQLSAVLQVCNPGLQNCTALLSRTCVCTNFSFLLMYAFAVAGCRQRVRSDRLLDMVQMQDVGLVMFKPTDADATPEEYGKLDKASGQDTWMSEQVCSRYVLCWHCNLWLQPLVQAGCVRLWPLHCLVYCFATFLLMNVMMARLLYTFL